jgi:hypothetical protein
MSRIALRAQQLAPVSPFKDRRRHAKTALLPSPVGHSISSIGCRPHHPLAIEPQNGNIGGRGRRLSANRPRISSNWRSGDSPKSKNTAIGGLSARIAARSPTSRLVGWGGMDGTRTFEIGKCASKCPGIYRPFSEFELWGLLQPRAANFENASVSENTLAGRTLLFGPFLTKVTRPSAWQAIG